MSQVNKWVSRMPKIYALVSWVELSCFIQFETKNETKKIYVVWSTAHLVMKKSCWCSQRFTYSVVCFLMVRNHSYPPDKMVPQVLYVILERTHVTVHVWFRTISTRMLIQSVESLQGGLSPINHGALHSVHASQH